MLYFYARVNGRAIGVVANRRGFLQTPEGPRIGEIVYTESARKVAYFVETAERQGLPLLYLQDVSGFMIGVEAEAEGMIRAGAEMVGRMAWARGSKVIVTREQSDGAGSWGMGVQGFGAEF